MEVAMTDSPASTIVPFVPAPGFIGVRPRCTPQVPYTTKVPGAHAIPSTLSAYNTPSLALAKW